MVREHRELNGQTGELTVTPFTPEEEIIADQKDADRLAFKTLFNSPIERIKRITDGDDLRIVVFKLLFKLHNRILVLEGSPEITVNQFLTFLEGELS